MALVAANVRVGISGVLNTGLLTATAPTGTASALTGFTDLGYISEDGVKEKRERSTKSIAAWQNGATVRTIVTEGVHTFSTALLETTRATIEAFYGVSVTSAATEGNFTVIPTATGGRKSFVLDVVDGQELLRTYIPEGEITEVGEIQYVSKDVISREITITAYAATSLAGVGSAKSWMTALKT